MSRKRSRREVDGHADQGRRVSRQIAPATALRRDLFALGDPGRYATVEDIDIVAERVGRADPAILPADEVTTAIRECLLAVPIKVPLYGALVLRVSTYNGSLASHICEHMADTLPTLSAQGDWTAIKLVLRFYASLTRLPSAAGLVERWMSELAAGLEQRFDLCAAETLLLTIAYYMAYAANGDFGSLARLIGIVRECSQDHRLDDLQRPFESHVPHTQTSRFDALLEQCSRAVHERQAPNLLPRHLAGELVGPTDLTMPSTNIGTWPPAAGAASPAVLRLFTDQPIETVPGATELADSILRDLVVDTLDRYTKNRQEAARFLMDMECYLAPRLFVLRGTPVDKIAPNGPCWKAEDVVVEGIFGELLSLGGSKHKPVYYHSVLSELCKLVPQAIAPTFGRAIRTLYGWVPDLEPELVVRFGAWFAQHLSNFGYSWKWQDWEADLVPESLRRQFLVEVVHREAEYSYCQRVRTTLPESFLQLIPEDMPPLRHGLESEELVRAHGNTMELLPAVLKLRQDVAAVDLFLGCLLRIGSESCAHALDAVLQHSAEISDLLQADPPRLGGQIARTIMSVWQGRPSIGVQICLSLVAAQVIPPEALPACVENVPAGPGTSWYPYELVSHSSFPQIDGEKMSRALKRAIARRHL